MPNISTPTADPLFAGQRRPPNMNAYQPQELVFASSTNNPVVGDGTQWGGFGSAYAERQSYFRDDEDDYLIANAINLSDAAINIPANGGTSQDPKTRFSFATVESLLGVRMDPLRNFGGPVLGVPNSHLHTFLANTGMNPFSTFDTMRRDIGTGDGSVSTGGIANGSGYWMPSIIVTVGGTDYVVAGTTTTGYYQPGEPPNGATAWNMHPLINGMSFIGGFNMDNPWRYRDIRDGANLDAGFARYVYQNTATGSGTAYHGAMFHEWQLFDSSAPGGRIDSPYLEDPDGNDPFAGYGTVAGGATQLALEMLQDLAWDGVNRWHPNGYDNVCPLLRDDTAGGRTGPEGWYLIPSLKLTHVIDLVAFEAQFGQSFFASNPRLSSDHHANMMFSMPGRGFTVHWDYLPAWNDNVFEDWQREAIGCGVLGGVPREFATHRISGTQILDQSFHDNVQGSGIFFRAINANEGTSRTATQAA